MSAAARVAATGASLEAWAGVECSHVVTPVGLVDQLAATGHDRRDEDVERLASLGVTAVRYPVLWGRGRRGEPVPETDWGWAEARLEGLRALGLRPVIGLLHHGQGPLPGGLLDPAFPSAFAAYARQVAERVPWVKDWLPINEPLTTARFAGTYGLWAPYHRTWESGVRMLLAQCLAIRAAIRAIRDVVPGATLTVNEDAGRTRGSQRCRAAVRFANHRRWLTTDLLTGRVRQGHAMWRMLALDRPTKRLLDDLAGDPEPPDVIGVDYYVTSDRWLDHRLDRFPPWSHGGDGRLAYADVELVRVDAGRYRPFRSAIEDWWDRYRLPIVLAEVHLAGDPAHQVAWWHAAWEAAVEARAAGVDIRAVTAWSAFGAWHWSRLLADRGEYEPGPFDARTDVLTRTAVGDAVAATARGEMPASGAEGWWELPGRVAWRTRRRVRHAATGVPAGRQTRTASSRGRQGRRAQSPGSAAGSAATPASFERVSAQRPSSASRSADRVPGSAA
jgi:dTDP-4-dehydrorhamnose reductase